MSPDTIALVQESFKKIVPHADTVADVFYDRLFEIAPEVHVMFPAEMQEQKGKLMYVLGVTIKNLHQLDTMLDPLKELGAQHVVYGVKNIHYQLVGSALLYTLDKSLGNDWTPKLQEAWAQVYAALAGVMIGAASQKAAE